MNKLMRGIAEFLHRRRPEHEANFRSLAREQHPTGC